MSTAKSEAEHFIKQLEQLLEAAREAAVKTLLTDVSPADVNPVPAGTVAARPTTGGDVAHLTLYSCVSDVRDDRLRIVVQLQGGRAMYEGQATSLDFAEARERVAARAALAAFTEWAGVAPVSELQQNQRWQFGLRDVLPVATADGPTLLVTVAARLGSGDVVRLLGSAWRGDDPVVAAVRAVINAFTTGGTALLSH